MTIKNIALTGLASATIMAMTAGPVLACNHKPVQKSTDHKVVVTPAPKKVDCPKASPTPTPTTTPTPKPSTTPTPKPSPTPVADQTGKGGAQPVVLSTATVAPAVAAPAQLPVTGSTAGLSTLLGLPTLAIAGRAYLRSRSSR